MGRLERAVYWFRRHNRRTRHTVISVAFVGPWVLYVNHWPTRSLSSPLGEILIAGSIGAAAVTAAWSATLDLARWKRASMTFLFAVNLGLAEFSYIYWSLSGSARGAFSVPLNKTDAAYFTLTTFTTTGFGDIAARSEAARLVVTVQMALGFVAVAVGLAVLVANRPAAPDISER